MTKKRYPDEFKIEAVRQITDRGHSVADVSKRLDVSTHSLYAWVKKFGPDAEANKSRNEEQAELKRLRKELQRVTEERDILKKAAVDSIDQCNNHGKTRVIGDLLDETYVHSNRKRICF